MGQYPALVGKRVEAHYRAGDMHLSVSGTLVADTTQAICLEDRFSRDGREKTIRVEIPHAYVLQLRECSDRPERSLDEIARQKHPQHPY